MMTQQERAEVGLMLQAYWPGRIPAETATAWILSVATSKPADVTRAIVAMAENAEFPTLKALREELNRVLLARVKERDAAEERRLLAAYGTISPEEAERNRRALARIGQAIARGAGADEILAIIADRGNA